MPPQGRWALVVGVGAYPWLSGQGRLLGAVADAEAVADHLETDWGFPPASVRTVLDERATQAAILHGMEWLIERAGPGDAVVFYFAGHGCRLHCQDPEDFRLRPDRRQKILVPWDGGEAGQVLSERGIGGDLFRAWLPRLAARTSNVTLLFDCCHSGTVTRDGWGGRVRGLDPQNASPDPPLAPVEEPHWLGGSSTGGGVDYVAVAASRFDRNAYEIVTPDGTHRGVFTWYLVRQLERASRLGLSLAWQDVVDAVAVDVGSHCPHQHPRLEGRRDRELFGLREAPGRRFATVTKRDGGEVRLAAGRLQQVVRGSQWRVVAAGAAPEVGRSDEPRPAGTPLGSLRVTDVEVAASTAVVEEEASPGAVAPPARAWLAALPEEDDDLRLPVAVRSGGAVAAAEAALRRAVAGSPFLRLVEAGRGEEVTVLVPEPGGDGDPLQLGDLSAIAGRCWLAVGRDGLPVAPPHRLGEESVAVMVENLEKRARQRQLRLLRSPQSNETRSSETEPWVELTILRQAAEGVWEAVDEAYVFRAGERFAFSLTNRYREPLHVNLLGLGFGGGTSPLHPVAHAAAPFLPGATVSYGTRPGESLCFLLPPRYPYLPGAPYRRERELFKLIATSEEADYRLFFQDSYRDPARLPGLSGDRLGRFLGWYACGTAYRGASTRPTGPAVWSAYTRGQWLDTRPSGTA